MIRNLSMTVNEYVLNSKLKHKMIVARDEEENREEIESLIDLMTTEEKKAEVKQLNKLDNYDDKKEYNEYIDKLVYCLMTKRDEEEHNV